MDGKVDEKIVGFEEIASGDVDGDELGITEEDDVGIIEAVCVGEHVVGRGVLDSSLGVIVGVTVGSNEGEIDGLMVEIIVGVEDTASGDVDGDELGIVDGTEVEGEDVGRVEGVDDDKIEGHDVESYEGEKVVDSSVGLTVGVMVGSNEGLLDGAIVKMIVGLEDTESGEVDGDELGILDGSVVEGEAVGE